MKYGKFKGNMLPSYGDGAPVDPVEAGNIDISANNYAKYIKGGALQAFMVYKQGEFFTLVPKISPAGKEMTDSQAVRLYRKTNGHLGRFASENDAKKYQQWIKLQAKEVSRYFPDEPIIDSTPEDGISQSIRAKAAFNRSILRQNIKQLLSYSQKSLGRSIRRISEVFDPNAIDGDEDGIVQDGTMWARPALPGKPAIASLRSTTTGKRFIPEDTKRAASKLLNTLKKEEPEVTKTLDDLQKLSNSKAKLVDLDKKFKDLDSLAEKIERLKPNWNNDTAAAASQMNDGLRYTFVVPNEDDYSSFVRSTLSSIHGRGMGVTSWNYWNSGDPYSGVNAMIQHPNGFNYEIQFHTPKSLAAKKKMEPLYNKFRDETDTTKRKEIYDRMRAIGQTVKAPKDTKTIGDAVSRGHKIGLFNVQTALDSSRSSRSESRGQRPNFLASLFDSVSADAEIPMSPQEKKRFEAATDQWITALFSMAGIPNFDRKYSGPGPSNRGQGKSGQGIIGPWKGFGVVTPSSEMQQEVIASILEQVKWMRDRNDYSFFNWVPAYRGEEDISWWNNTLRRNGLAEIGQVPTRMMGRKKTTVDEAGNEKVETTQQAVPTTMEELLRRARNGVGARIDKRYKTERTASSKGGGRDDDETVGRDLGVTEVDYDSNIDDEAQAGEGISSAPEYERPETEIGEELTKIEPYISGTETIEIEKDGEIVSTTAPTINTEKLLATMDEMAGAISDEEGPVTKLSKNAPKMFKVFVDRYIRLLSRPQMERVTQLSSGTLDSLYPETAARNIVKNRQVVDRLGGSETLGELFGGEFATTDIENWHNIIDKMADEYAKQPNMKTITKKFGITQFAADLLKDDIVSLADMRGQGVVSGPARKGKKATAIDKREIADIIRQIVANGGSLGDLYNAIYAYMGKQANVTKATYSNARINISSFLGIPRDQLTDWLIDNGWVLSKRMFIDEYENSDVDETGIRYQRTIISDRCQF